MKTINYKLAYLKVYTLKNLFRFFLIFKRGIRQEKSYKVGCRGVVKLGGPDLLYNEVGPTEVGARKYFLWVEYFKTVIN